MWRSYRNGSRRRHFLRRLLIFVLGLQAWQSTSLLADEWTNAQAITSIYMVQNVNVGGGTIIAQYSSMAPAHGVRRVAPLIPWRIRRPAP